MPDIDAYTLERYSADLLNHRTLLKLKETVRVRKYLGPDYCGTYEQRKERFPGIFYLEPVLGGVFPPQDPFPVIGKVAASYGQNARMLVSLVCKYLDNAPVNIVFVIATESPYTFLSQEAAKALKLPAARVSWPVQLQTPTTVDCYPSAAGFVHANILGADFFLRNHLKLRCGFVGDGITNTVKIFL